MINRQLPLTISTLQHCCTMWISGGKVDITLSSTPHHILFARTCSLETKLLTQYFGKNIKYFQIKLIPRKTSVAPDFTTVGCSLASVTHHPRKCGRHKWVESEFTENLYFTKYPTLPEHNWVENKINLWIIEFRTWQLNGNSLRFDFNEIV